MECEYAFHVVGRGVYFQGTRVAVLLDSQHGVWPSLQETVLQIILTAEFVPTDVDEKVFALQERVKELEALLKNKVDVDSRVAKLERDD